MRSILKARGQGNTYAQLRKVPPFSAIYECAPSPPQPMNLKARDASARTSAVRATAVGHKPSKQTASKNHFPIVGIGASAGGLEAFTQLLRSLPLNTGMAFVLVQHLDPDHESSLAQILGRTTAIQVCEVRDRMKVLPDRIYVIPPNVCMEIVKGVLKLRPREKRPGAARSIDVFFESLAQNQQQR